MSIACPLDESRSTLDQLREARASRARRATSAKRIAANRANAQKSTGPRTADGKWRASRNALKHGLCGTYSHLPGEEEATFEIFVNELEAEMRPRTVLQRNLFPQIANLLWRIRRLPEAESALFVRESGKAAVDDSEMLTSSEVLARRFSDDPSNGFMLMGRYERGMQNALLRMIRQFHALQRSHPTTPYADGDGHCPREGSEPACARIDRHRKEQRERAEAQAKFDAAMDARARHVAEDEAELARERALVPSPGKPGEGEDEGDFECGRPSTFEGPSPQPSPAAAGEGAGEGAGERTQTKPPEIVAGERETRKCAPSVSAPVTKRTHYAEHEGDVDRDAPKPMPRAPIHLQSAPAEPGACGGVAGGESIGSTETQ